MREPTRRDWAVSIGGLVASAASMFAVSMLSHGQGAPASPEALLASLGVNLASSGLAALCNFGIFRAKEEYRETLANHDILRVFRASWSEAAAATVKAYADSHAAGPRYSIPPQEEAARQAFLELCRTVAPRDFEATASVDIRTIREGIAAARRMLLTPEHTPAEAAPGSPEDADPEQARRERFIAELTTALAENATSVVAAKWNVKAPSGRATSVPREFEDYVSQPGAPGIFGQFCAYLAFHLKTDPRAQTAVLHITLQDNADAQARLGDAARNLTTLCEEIRRGQSDGAKEAMAGFEARIAQQTKEITDHIDRAFNNHVSPSLRAPFASGQSDSGASRFTYRQRATRLLGRDDAMNDLVAFLSDERPGLWTVLTGPAGTGKSRLAAELIAKVRLSDADQSSRPAPGDWRSGFLRSGDHWLKTEAVRWFPDADTLIVIDYASSLEEKALSVFLADLGERAGPFKIRVLLLDRLHSEEDQSVVKRLTRGKDDEKEVLNHQWQPPSSSLSLKPLGAPQAVDVARDWAGASAWSPAMRTRVEQAIQDDEQLARPLFAALIGDAIRNRDLPAGILDAITVSRAALARLFRAEALGRAAQLDPEAVRTGKMVLAAAVAAQGIPQKQVFQKKVLCNLTGATGVSDHALLAAKQYVAAFFGSIGESVPPIEPDFLAGLFVLEQLLALDEKSAADRADALMELAWRHGRDPDGFLVRLSGDFFNKVEKVAEAITLQGSAVDGDSVLALLERLVLSTLKPEGLAKSDGGPMVAASFYAGVAALLPTVALLAEQFQSAFTSQAYPSIELAYSCAIVIYNATVKEKDPRRCEALAVQVGEIRKIHDSPEIALQQAVALFHATVVEKDPQRRDALTKQIEELRRVHDSPDIAQQQALALFNAAVIENDPQRGKALADQIGEIRKTHDSPQFELWQAMAIHIATEAETNPQPIEEITKQIEGIRKICDSPEIALALARGLLDEAMERKDGPFREALALQIGAIREPHDSPEIALREARALLSATVTEENPHRHETLAERIGDIRKVHDSPEIALLQATALYNTTVGENDPQRCEVLAEQIGKIRTLHDSSEIALLQAKALLNATVVENDPQRCRALAFQIGEISKLHDSPEIALQQAEALYNATVAENDPQRCEALARQIADIRKVHDSPEIALEQAQALYNATVDEKDQERCQALARQIADIRNVHDAPEIALRQAKALFNATVGENDPQRRAALARQIADIRKVHDSPEIAMIHEMANRLANG